MPGSTMQPLAAGNDFETAEKQVETVRIRRVGRVGKDHSGLESGAEVVKDVGGDALAWQDGGDSGWVWVWAWVA